MYSRPRFRRVPSYAGIDDACSDLLDNLDPELLVPLDLPSDVPFKPRLTEIKVQLFLRAMLKCAPLYGRSYIVKNVLATRGAEAKLQRLAGVWFNRIVFLGALYPCFILARLSIVSWVGVLTGTRLEMLQQERCTYQLDPQISQRKFTLTHSKTSDYTSSVIRYSQSNLVPP